MATNFSLTALTGINSASTGLGVISNNISNAQTIGFKSSRAEFADLFYGAQNNPGTGARTQAVTQNFSQGAVNDTGNQLDLAISGNGLFILEDISGRYEAVYTRNGSFKLDKEGFITDQMGNKLQGFNKDGVLSTPDTNIYQTVLGSLNIGELNKVPKETSQVNFDMNLNGQDPVTYTTTSTGVKQSASGVLFDINTLKNQQYDGAPNYSTSKVIYDSLGGQHRMTVNYYKAAVNPPGTYSAAAPANTVNYSNETTDWYAQYIMEDYDPATNTYFKSGSGQDAATNGANNTTAYTATQTAITAFGTPATAADAGTAAATFVTGMFGSSGAATAAQIAAADAAAQAAFTTGGATAALQATLDFARSQGLQFATTDTADSTRLALLFGNPTTALEASNAARNAALAMGLTQQQAAQSASAAQTAWTASAAVAPTAPTVTTTDGTPTTTETAAVAFSTGLTAGQSVTIGGLTLTATGTISAADVAAGYASLLNGATTGNSVINGAWSGTLTGWGSGGVVAGGVTFTSSTANTDVTNLTATTTGAGNPQVAFDAAFGAAGVTPSIPDSVVQAYRFDSQGKLLD
ncbi:MAG: hypothetical protein B7Y29_07210, partial [Thiotrichales bacterium 16-46-22]